MHVLLHLACSCGQPHTLLLSLSLYLPFLMSTTLHCNSPASPQYGFLTPLCHYITHTQAHQPRCIHRSNTTATWSSSSSSSSSSCTSMEESISSSRTSSTAFYCNNGGYYGYGIAAAAASEDSGWTAYFDDFLQASREEPAAPAREQMRHGVCATASTLSSGANNKKLVKVMGAGQEKKTAHNLELEDPLQDTASSPANATQLQVDAWSTLYGRSQQGTEEVEAGFYQTVDVWGITSCSEQRPPVQQWSAGDVNGIGMGQAQQQEAMAAANECCTELQKGGVCYHLL